MVTAAAVEELEHRMRVLKYEFAALRFMLCLEHGYDVFEEKAHYNPAQPRAPAGRPDGGRWIDAGGGGGAAHDGARLLRIQEEEEDNPRRSIFLDPEPSIRRDIFELHLRDIRRLEPNNRELPSITTGRGYVPDQQTVARVHTELESARDRAAENVMEHGFEQHGREFNLVSRYDYYTLARRTIADPESRVEELTRGRTIYYDRRTNTLVIVNGEEPSQSTMFRPSAGERIVDQLGRGRR